MSPLHSPNATALRGLRSLSRRYQHQLTTTPATQTRTLWNGTTQPYMNHAIPHGSTIQQHQASQDPPSPLLPPPAGQDESTQIRTIHTKYIQDLLLSQQHPFTPPTTTKNAKTRRAAAHQQQQQRQSPPLYEAPVFRTDGPLTPYPISLDTGERLEPRRASLVRVVDRGGVERNIVVAEVDDRSGNQRSILLALDLHEYGDEGMAVGKRITAEEMYATLGLEAQGGRF